MSSNKKDFAVGIVLTAPSPATSGTSLVLQTGQGARMPAVPFFATYTPSGQMTSLDNSEKLSVTAVTTDTLTIVRAQGGTMAQSIVVGGIISNGVYSDDVDSKADIASPTFTGTPATPTATAGDSTTKIASTAFVQQAVRSTPGKEASEYATTTVLPTVVYNNGSSGVGATLTAVGVGALSLDGQSPIVSDRILVKNQASSFQNGIYCLDETTEILTKNGWKHHSQLQEKDIALTYNLEKKYTEWQPVESIHRFDVIDEDMLSMEIKGHSSLSTMNHRWITSHFESNKERITLSKDLSTHTAILKIAPNGSLPKTKKYSDAFVELVAWFFTEGHIRKTALGTLTTGVRIVQSDVVNPLCVDKIRECLTVLIGKPSTKLTADILRGNKTAKWRERKNSNGQGLTTFDLNTTAGKLLCDIAPGRVVSLSFINELTEDQLHLFIETTILADGNISKKGQKTLGQNDVKRLEPVQHACILAGIPTTLIKKNKYGLSVLGINKKTRTLPHKKTVKYTGIVWCPKTENGTWIARRNGTVYITGNTITATGSGIAVFVMTRALDFNETNDIKTGAATYVVGGTTQAGTTWDVNSADSPVMGTDAITFIQSAGPGSLIAGTGIGISGVTVAIDTSITVDKTTVQTLTNKTVDGVTPTIMGYLDATSSVQTQLNSKQATLSLTTTGASGAATLTGATLNIPQYSGGGGGITFSAITTSQTAAINTGYLTNAATLITLTLPATAAVGSVIEVAGMGTGLWKVAQNASGVIHFGNKNTTTGTGGSLASSLQFDTLRLVCSVANNEWVVLGAVGNLVIL